MQMLRTISIILAQTAQQKSMTLAGLCVVSVFFMIMCMDKSPLTKTLKWIMLGFMVFFMVAAVLYYFLVVR